MIIFNKHFEQMYQQNCYEKYDIELVIFISEQNAILEKLLQCK